MEADSVLGEMAGGLGEVMVGQIGGWSRVGDGPGVGPRGLAEGREGVWCSVGSGEGGLVA